jgi:Fe-S oxidoreductase
LYRSNGPKGALSTPDLDAEDTVGASRISGFTWKQMLDLYSCTECGRCHDVCPAQQSGKLLSPREQVLRLKHHLIETSPALLKHASPDSFPEFVGSVVSTEEIWDCVTCRACQEVCPVDIEHVSRIVDIRRDRVLMKAAIPDKIQRFYRNIEENSNPWGKAWVYRGNWAQGLNILKPEAEKSAETIYWAGCLGAFDERIQRVAISLSRLMKTSGIGFTVLGSEEQCCGDAARRTGNEYLFQQLALRNIRNFERYQVKRIITACPHCYNVFKHEYPRFGGKYEVIHHSQLIESLLRQGTLAIPGGQPEKKVVYHDPCYLGRYNDGYTEPRRIIESISGLTMIEKNPNGNKALCCGAGGGAMWMSETGERRVSGILLDQVIEKQPDIVATACPYCLTMLENEVREKGMGTSMAVLDIVEILQNALSAKKI